MSRECDVLEPQAKAKQGRLACAQAAGEANFLKSKPQRNGYVPCKGKKKKKGLSLANLLLPGFEHVAHIPGNLGSIHWGQMEGYISP